MFALFLHHLPQNGLKRLVPFYHELTITRAQVEELKRINDALEQEHTLVLEKVTEERDAKTKEAWDVTLDRERFRGEVEQLKSTVRDLEGSISDLKLQIAATEEDQEEFQKKLKSKDQEKEQLRQEAMTHIQGVQTSWQQSWETAQTQWNTDMEMVKAGLQGANADLEKRINTLSIQARSAEDEKFALNKQLKEIQDQVGQANIQTEDMRRRCTSLESELSSVQSSLDQTKYNMQSEVSSKDSEISSLNYKLQSATEELTAKAALAEQATLYAKNVEEQCMAMNTKLQEVQQQAQMQVQQTQEQAQMNIDASERNVRTLQEKVDALGSKVIQAAGGEQTAVQKMQVYQRDYETMKSEKATMAAREKELQERVDELEAKLKEKDLSSELLGGDAAKTASPRPGEAAPAQGDLFAPSSSLF